MREFLDKLRNNFFYMGLGRESLLQIRKPVDERNRRDLFAWSCFVSIYMVISLLLSLCSPAFEACRPVYIITLALCFVTGVYAKFLGKRFPKWLSAMIHLFSLTTLGMGLGIAFFQPDTRTVTATAISIIIPTCFIIPTPVVLVWQVLSVITFVAIGHGLLAPDPYSFGLLTLILFAVMGTMIGHRVNKSRFERFFYADSAEKLVELQTRYAYYDQMTNIRNRRAYSERLQELSDDIPDDLNIIMVDVNSLKETNDSQGHRAGDELLIGTTECLVAAFEDVGTVYRIGGDEFCVIMLGTPEDVAEHIDRMEQAAECWEGTYIKGISVSYGIGTADDGDDPDAIVKKADQRMYESKREYYMSHGIDRRRR